MNTKGSLTHVKCVRSLLARRSFTGNVTGYCCFLDMWFDSVPLDSTDEPSILFDLSYFRRLLDVTDDLEGDEDITSHGVLAEMERRYEEFCRRLCKWAAWCSCTFRAFGGESKKRKKKLTTKRLTICARFNIEIEKERKPNQNITA